MKKQYVISWGCNIWEILDELKRVIFEMLEVADTSEGKYVQDKELVITIEYIPIK